MAKTTKSTAKSSRSFVGGKKKRLSLSPVTYGIFLVVILVLSAAGVFGYNKYKAYDYQAKASKYYTEYGKNIVSDYPRQIRFAFCKRPSVGGKVYVRVYVARPALLFFSEKGTHMVELHRPTSIGRYDVLDTASVWYTAGHESVTAVEGYVDGGITPPQRVTMVYGFRPTYSRDFMNGSTAYSSEVVVKDLPWC